MGFGWGGKTPQTPTFPETNMETAKRAPIKTTVLLKGDDMGFYVSLGECMGLESLNAKP